MGKLRLLLAGMAYRIRKHEKLRLKLQPRIQPISTMKSQLMPTQRHTALIFASAITLLLLALSGLQPFDRTTWVLEIFPILIALPLLWGSYRTFPLTNLLYTLIFCHAIVLMVGGAYSYARVPIGFDIADWLHLSRNPYDKIGHFFQGFVPAMVAREIFIRGKHVQGRKMLPFLVICVVLAVSATYELIEWAAAVSLGQGADEFLGTQGDPWDTQSDMFFALLGSISALLCLSRLHDRQLAPYLAVGKSAD
jgi:putative membrane protein